MSRRGQGEGSVYQRKDLRWVTSITLGWEDGKQKRKEIYGATQKEVQDRLIELRRAQQQGFNIAPERQTVKQYLAYWLDEHVKKDCRPATVTSYSFLINNHIVPYIGHVLLPKLSGQQIKMLLNDREKDGLSRRTVQYLHAVLRAALSQAVRLELVSRNAAAMVRPPRVEKREMHPLTPEQCARLLAAGESDRIMPLYSTALALGLREAECFGLRWPDIDLEHGRLNVRFQLQRVNKCAVFVPPKTEKSRRALPVPAVLLATLRKHRAKQDEERLLCGSRWQDYDLVFCSPIGTPLDPSNMIKHFQRLLKRAGIPKCRIHDLRHSCASLLLSQGVPLKTISEILGHSQISLTANTYGHLTMEVKRDALDKMDAVLSPLAVNVAVKSTSTKPN